MTEDEMREAALKLASEFSISSLRTGNWATAAEVVARAQVYYEFIKGQPREVPDTSWVKLEEPKRDYGR